MNRFSIRDLILILFILLCYRSAGQITIQTGPAVTPGNMVEYLLDKGMSYSNVTFQGSDLARGIFTEGDTSILGFGNGIFLSTGDGNDIPGPNVSGSTGTDFSSLPGWEPPYGSGNLHDLAVLSFYLEAESDTLSFRYVFGSEEYNEWVDSSFNDVFGLLISGPDPQGGYYTQKNLAIVPGTVDTFVTINNVNNGWASAGTVPMGPCTNCEYFTDNTGGMTFEYDGFTTVLTAWIPVIPCELYQLEIFVADNGDGMYDSGIFIEANSIAPPRIETELTLSPPDLAPHMTEGIVSGDLLFTLPDPFKGPMTINFEIGGTTDPVDDFEEEIPTSLYFWPGKDTASIHIKPVYDGIIEGEESLLFYIQNDLGCNLWVDTVYLIIIPHEAIFGWASPDAVICAGQQIELSVAVQWGLPPYTYLWEPGSMNTPSVIVVPQETTQYKVYCQDAMSDTLVDSVLVTVMPVSYEMDAFTFEKEDNPSLPWTVIGELSENSISLEVPEGTDLTGLVATFDIPDGSWAVVNGVTQENGITPNDFSNPVVYKVVAPGGCSKDWTVLVSLATGTREILDHRIIIAGNPADEKLVIYNAAGYELNLMDNTGKSVIRSTVTGAEHTLNTSSLPDGIYFLAIKNAETYHTRKIIVIH